MSSEAQKPHLNPVAPENLLNPVPLYKDLREHDPVHWSDAVHGWFITRYEDVLNGFRDPRLSANRRMFLEHQLQVIGLSLDDARHILDTARLQMLHYDGPGHLRLRRQASPSFTPQVLDTWRPAIRRIMHELMEPLWAQGQMDLVKEITYQLPPLVIAEFLGVPSEDREKFRAWTRPIAEFSSPVVGMDMRTVAREANDAMRDMNEYLRAILEDRRKAPREDMLSRMAQGEMTPEEAVANANLILSAGHLTTTDQLANAVYDLLTHPDQLQKLRGDLSLMKSALEELLRFTPAVPYMHRVAMENFQLHGRTIRKGDILLLAIGSANRDPTIFPDPDRFDITRDHVQQKHLTFAFGAHHCLGAGLARRELEIALEVLLARLPGLRLDEDRPSKLKYESMLFRGFNALYLRW